jgi:hypothetical protein
VRRIVELSLVVAGLALAVAAAHGDGYPSRRISLIAPWPPAGAIDTVCRELAPGVGDLLGQPVVAPASTLPFRVACTTSQIAFGVCLSIPTSVPVCFKVRTIRATSASDCSSAK